MSETPQRINVFFRLTVAVSVVFIVTIFAIVAAAFVRGNSPLTQFLQEHGGSLIAAEVAAALFLGLLALIVDQRGIVRPTDAAEVVADPDRGLDDSSGDIPEL